MIDTKLILGALTKFEQASATMNDAELGEFVRVTLKTLDLVDELEDLIQKKELLTKPPVGPEQ